jgi:uncharacterized protein YqgC (DUF456 family)
MEPLLLLIGLLAIALGLVGLLLPALPGSPLIFGGAVLVAWADHFTRVGPLALVLIALLALTGTAADYAATLLGARKAGASKWGMAGAVIGLLAGLPFGLPGIVLGPAIGATALEYFKDPDAKRAATAGAGVLVGFVVGTAAKYACAFAMIGVLLVSYLF